MEGTTVTTSIEPEVRLVTGALGAEISGLDVNTLTDEGFALLERAAPSHVEAVRRNFVEAVHPEDYAAMGRAFSAVLQVPQA